VPTDGKEPTVDFVLPMIVQADGELTNTQFDAPILFACDIRNNGPATRQGDKS